MNQGKLEVVKQEMARVNINILRISELKWNGGDGSKIQCSKEEYCIGTWNVRSMNQGKLEVVK